MAAHRQAGALAWGGPLPCGRGLTRRRGDGYGGSRTPLPPTAGLIESPVPSAEATAFSTVAAIATIPAEMRFPNFHHADHPHTSWERKALAKGYQLSTFLAHQSRGT